MKFKPAVPHNVISRKTGKVCLQTYYRYITYNRTGHTYTTFRYFAACRLFDKLKTAI